MFQWESSQWSTLVYAAAGAPDVAASAVTFTPGLALEPALSAPITPAIVSAFRAGGSLNFAEQGEARLVTVRRAAAQRTPCMHIHCYCRSHACGHVHVYSHMIAHVRAGRPCVCMGRQVALLAWVVMMGYSFSRDMPMNRHSLIPLDLARGSPRSEKDSC